MARLRQTLSEDEVRRRTVSDVRKAYLDLAADYNKIINNRVLYCHTCNEFHAVDGFYTDDRFASGVYPICKKTLLKEATDYDAFKETYTDNREKTMKVFQKMDLPFIATLYESALRDIQLGVGERNKKTAYQHMLTMVKTLPQYKDKRWADSEFEDIPEEETKIIKKVAEAGKKRFGNGYSDEDYMFLENEYQDWVTRYECNTKGQEEVFENLSVIKLLKKRAILKGESTKDLDKQQQDWLDAGKLKPKQNTTDTLSDAQTFGTFIQKIEETRPCAEIDPELQDVDNIGLYIDAFFRGHTSKMMGLKNKFTHIYEKVMGKYTVNKPQYDAEEDSEDIFEKVFGANIGE